MRCWCRYDRVYPLVWISDVCRQVAEAAQSQLEWMSDSVGKVRCLPPRGPLSLPCASTPPAQAVTARCSRRHHGLLLESRSSAALACLAQAFEMHRSNPFHFRAIRLLSSVTQLAQLPPGPKVGGPRRLAQGCRTAACLKLLKRLVSEPATTGQVTRPSSLRHSLIVSPS